MRYITHRGDYFSGTLRTAREGEDTATAQRIKAAFIEHDSIGYTFNIKVNAYESIPSPSIFSDRISG